jgi:hypothetical protein
MTAKALTETRATEGAERPIVAGFRLLGASAILTGTWGLLAPADLASAGRALIADQTARAGLLVARWKMPTTSHPGAAL